jgi:hypothetical protein
MDPGIPSEVCRLFVLLKIFCFLDTRSTRSLAHTSSIWNIIDESSSLLSCALTSARRNENLREARRLTSKPSMSHGHYDVELAQLSSARLDSTPRICPRPCVYCGAGGDKRGLWVRRIGWTWLQCTHIIPFFVGPETDPYSYEITDVAVV